MPTRWFAGPYERYGPGTGGSTSYEVWGLPEWSEEADRLYRTLGGGEGIMAFIEDLLGASPGHAATIVQVPPEMGGGIAFPEAGFCIIAATDAGSRPRFGSAGDPRMLWIHEYTHLVNSTLPEGVADYTGLRYLESNDPLWYIRELESRRDYFLDAAREHGDRAIADVLRDWSLGHDIPEIHAFAYTKPALVWNMFGALFGHEATAEVIRDLGGYSSPTDQLEFTRRRMEEAAPGRGAAFFDRWFTECVPMDLAIEDISIEEEGANVSLVIRDNHGPDYPPAREAIPWVEVAVYWEAEDGTVVTSADRVELSGESDETTVTITVGGQPIAVRLDPNQSLLDYNPSNNVLDHSKSSGVPSTEVFIVVGAGVAVLAAWLIWRRRRLTQDSPPQPGNLARVSE